MKKFLLLSCMFIASVCSVSAYTTIVVQDSISTNTHWTCDNQYLLKGYVYVTSGATLTIDPGTIIRGDKDTKGALIIERGAKIMAMGTVTSPVIFTSNQDAGSRNFGDWGGVILCGKSPVNWTAGQAQVEGGPRSFYGGTDPHDNSGEMHYVRIEFGGVAFSPNNEVNSLTLCGVGDATQIDHIQASFNGDDAFEWFGGTVNAKYLVAFRTWDDDFDTDCGFQGKNQFVVAVRDPFAADQSGSHGFESDSYQTGTYSGIPVDATKLTKPIFSNCTIIGPLVSPSSTAYDPQYVSGIHIRRGSSLSFLNSIIAGFPCGVLIDESSSSFGSTSANIASNELQFRNNIVCGNANFPSTSVPKDVMYVINGARSLTSTAANGDTVTGNPFSPYAGPLTWLYNPAFGNKTYPTEQTGVQLGGPFTLTNPGLVPNSTSPVVYNAAHPFNPNNPINYDTSGGYVNYNVPTVPPDFSSSKANDAFFTRTNYIGAFPNTGHSTDNWMKGWCNFDPNNTDYNKTCVVIDTTEAVAEVNNGAVDGAKVFPNPTSGDATILLEMHNTSVIKIAITDMTGKRVKEVYDAVMNSGMQTVSFSTSDLSSGMYIISIISDKKQKSIKLNVIK